MRKVLIYSFLLLGGLAASQVLPTLGPDVYEPLTHIIRLLTMVGLAFIMIHVGQEFDLEKSNLRKYGWDYVVAATAATFPWIFVTLYFVFVLAPPEFWGQFALWKEALLQGRFAAPTSAGVLFSMLAAAGLGATWMFRKARILAIFDDLDTILLMVPLTILLVGFRWQLAGVVASSPCCSGRDGSTCTAGASRTPGRGCSAIRYCSRSPPSSSTWGRATWTPRRRSTSRSSCPLSSWAA